jgi:hypothetical protein
MSIANELSSEVAAAMLTNEKDKGSVNPNELLSVVLEVHTTLRRMTQESRRKSLRSLSDPSPTQSTTVAGSH